MSFRTLTVTCALVLLIPAVARAQVTPEEQRQADAQLAAPKLAASPTVTIDLTATPVSDIIAAISRPGSISVRYHSGVTNLNVAASAKISNASFEDALQMVTASRGLAFKVTGAKSVFIYPNTPENRDKYTDVQRTFTLVNADAAVASQRLNQALTAASLGPDDLRPAIVSLNASRSIIVRATKDMMPRIAKLIADADK